MADDKILEQLQSKYPDLHELTRLCGSRPLANVAHAYLKRGEIDLQHYSFFCGMSGRSTRFEHLEARVETANQQGLLLDLGGLDLIRYAQGKEAIARRDGPDIS